VGDDAEVEAARRLVERKLASTRGLDAATRQRRTLAALGRRGYAPGLVARLVREALGREGEPDDTGVTGLGWGDRSDE
jgi:regulatory protein